MLRLLVVVLLLANLGWLAWTRGWLPAGWLPPPGDAAQREPQRVARQVRPDAIVLQPIGADTPPAPGDLGAGACLQAGPLRPDAWSAAVAAVEGAGVAPTAWLRVSADADLGADWLRVPDADPDMARRLQALAGDGLSFAPCP